MEIHADTNKIKEEHIESATFYTERVKESNSPHLILKKIKKILMKKLL